MAISQSVCYSFKQEALEGLHNFASSGGDTFRIALYTSSATLGTGTTAYTTSNEVTGTGYTAGGNTLTNLGTFLSTGTAYIDWSDTTWTSSTITARGALVYNSTNSDRAVIVLDFGTDKSSTAGDFTIIFPTPSAASAILRLS